MSEAYDSELAWLLRDYFLFAVAAEHMHGCYEKSRCVISRKSSRRQPVFASILVVLALEGTSMV